MSKCGCGKGGEGNPAISKYGGGSPMPKNPYLREGAAPFRASLYGFDGFAMPRGYAANPIGRYGVFYSKEPGTNHYRPIERYKHPKLKENTKPLVPFIPFAYESDTFHETSLFDRDAQLSRYDSQTKHMPELLFKRPPYLVDEEEIKKRYRMMWEHHN